MNVDNLACVDVGDASHRCDAMNQFDEVELFNKYVQEHSQEFASIMTGVSGNPDLVRAANRLGFNISNERVNAYVRAKFSQPYREQMTAETVHPEILTTSSGVVITTTASIFCVNCITGGSSAAVTN